MNAITKVQGGALALPEDKAIEVLRNSLYPGARPESVALVLSWCQATGRDPMKKPVHIVPMWVKEAGTDRGRMQDVIMPGIGTYRTDAARTGEYAGKSEPEFGPDVAGEVGGVKMTYPKWCKVTVYRTVGGKDRSFTALEYWTENYATKGKDSSAPNAMWLKRPYGQLAKCSEAQALRMAFPDETGNTNTMEEMEGKTFDGVTLDSRSEPVTEPKRPTPTLLQPSAPKAPRPQDQTMDELMKGDDIPPWDAPAEPEDKAGDWTRTLIRQFQECEDIEVFNEIMSKPSVVKNLANIAAHRPELDEQIQRARAAALDRITAAAAEAAA